jgi:hypothetical protein
MRTGFDHSKFTALCVLLNSDSGLSVAEYDEYMMMLYAARCRIEWLAEQRGCSSCLFFDRGCTKADGKLPPEKIQKTGCEVYENKHIIPF